MCALNQDRIYLAVSVWLNLDQEIVKVILFGIIIGMSYTHILDKLFWSNSEWATMIACSFKPKSVFSSEYWKWALWVIRIKVYRLVYQVDIGIWRKIKIFVVIYNKE